VSATYRLDTDARVLHTSRYFMGSLFSAMVPGEKKLGLTFLVLSRMVYGCGIGSAMHSVPVYIAEMAPPSVRGFLISLKEAVIVFGMFMGYVVGGAFMSQVRHPEPDTQTPGARHPDTRSPTPRHPEPDTQTPGA
jgi:MFS family permease